jgi:hypothetical protein
MNQNLWMHVLSLRFRRGNWAPNVWGTLELPSALISNHQISIFSLFAYRIKICWWMFAIWGFKGGIGPPTFWGPQNFTGALISNHQTSKFSLFCLKSENLLVGVCNLRFRRWKWTLNVWGTSKFCTRAQFEITKHLYLANLAQWATITVQGFEFQALMVVLDPTTWGTSKFHRDPDFK